MRPDALYFTSLLVKGRELPLNGLKDFAIPGEEVIKRTENSTMSTYKFKYACSMLTKALE
jgi:hypothetical protein